MAYNMSSLNVGGGCNYKIIIITLVIIDWGISMLWNPAEKRGIYFLLEAEGGSSEKRQHLNSSLKKKKKRKKNLLEQENCWSKVGHLMLQWGCCLHRNGFWGRVSRSEEQHKLHLEWGEGLSGIRGWKWSLRKRLGSLARKHNQGSTGKERC